MKYDASTPIYLQVVNAIKKDIVSNKIGIGEKLPSGRDLALEYKINPNTAARVYQILEQEGICVTKRGLGTFVSEDSIMVVKLRKEMTSELIEHFMKNMGELGFSKDEIIEMIKRGEQ